MTSLTRLHLPESHRSGRENVRDRGGLVLLSGSDIGMPPMDEQRAREYAATLFVEDTLPLLVAVSLIRGRSLGHDAAEIHRGQIDAINELLPGKYRDDAIDYIKADLRDAAIFPEQLLLAMRLVIEHGKPGSGTGIDKLGIATLLMGLNDVLGADLDPEDGLSPEDLSITLALRRLGLPSNQAYRYELARMYDLLVTRARAAARRPGAVDLNELFRGYTSVSIGDFMTICFCSAAPLASGTNVEGLVEANFHTALASLQQQFRDPVVAQHTAELLIADVDDLRTAFAQLQ